MELKEEILSLTNELKEQINTNNQEYLETLEQLKEKVESFSNEQVQKKFNGVESFIMNEDLTNNEKLSKALDYIEYFKDSVEKNYLKDNGEMLPTIEKFIDALNERNQEKIVICAQEFIAYMKTLEDSEKLKNINNKLSSILSEINNKDIKELTSEELNELINKANELANIINDKVEIEITTKPNGEETSDINENIDSELENPSFVGIENENEFAIPYQLDDNEIDLFQELRSELKELLKNPEENQTRIDDIRREMATILGLNKLDEVSKETNIIPEDLSAIRKEMDQILGKSLFEGIENENEFAIPYQLDDNEIDLFQELRSELKELLKNPEENKSRIDDIRAEMFAILGIDPYTYQDNKKIIDNLEEPNKSRFAELKKKHDELMEEKFKKTKPEKDVNPEPVVPTKDDEEKEPTDLIPVTPEPKPVPVPEKKGKKKRLVKVIKSAKEFYKKHKKAILLVGGLVLGSILLTQLLPSIMYMNSVLWGKFALGSAQQATLHNINLLIGKTIGASYTNASGIWTLANGALLNATAAEASLLASIGKVTLLSGGLGVTTTVAVKNAIKLAKEKIAKFKNREKKPEKEEVENKTNIFTTAKDAFSKGYEKGKSKVTEKWDEYKNKKEEKETLEQNDEKNEEKPFSRSDISPRINSVINTLIAEGFITKEQQQELETADIETFMTKFKEIYHNYETKDIKKEEPTLATYEYDQEIEDYIKFSQETGLYTEKDVATLRTIPPEMLRQYLQNDPNFLEFQQMSNERENLEEEKGKGSK